MFGWFRRRQKFEVVASVPNWSKATELSDGALTGLLINQFEQQHARSSALFLVGYFNWVSYYSAFKHTVAAQSAGKYIGTLDGYVTFLSELSARHTSDSVPDVIASRRSFHLFLSTLLKIAQNRVRANGGSWDDIAEVWIRLLPGARLLGKTLDETALWDSDDIREFEKIKTELDGESFCLAHLAPEEVRYHPKIQEWLEKDLPLEIKAELESMKADMRKMMGG